MIWVNFASIASVEALRDVPERHLSFKCVWSFLNLLTGLQYLRYHFFYWYRCYKTIIALFERVYWGLNFWYFSQKFAEIKIQAICTLLWYMYNQYAKQKLPNLEKCRRSNFYMYNTLLVNARPQIFTILITRVFFKNNYKKVKSFLEERIWILNQQSLPFN